MCVWIVWCAHTHNFTKLTVRLFAAAPCYNTHKPEIRKEESYCNTGSWVEGESTFAAIIEGEVHLFRMKNGVSTEIDQKL
jgi:hypothetical protein